MGGDVEELAERFRRQAEGAESRAPLYAAMSRIVAEDDALLGLLLHPPPEQRLPVLFLAAVHLLVLAEPDAPLAAWYPNLTSSPRSNADTDDLTLALRAFCSEHEDELIEVLSTRSTQTNEVGRCALFVPAFALVAADAGPISHLDVGASAGLNLLWALYGYRYDPGGELGDPSVVAIECGTRGDVPVPATIPAPAGALGLDREPIDVMDDVQARWLEACVWPDQHDRFRRLHGAIGIARQDPPEVRRGDAIDDLACAVADAGSNGHPVVTNSWVLNYFDSDGRRAYLAELERLGAADDLSWLFLESPELVPELPVDDLLDDPRRRQLSTLTLVTWRSGQRSVRHLATCHPHGYWMHWLG